MCIYQMKPAREFRIGPIKITAWNVTLPEGKSHQFVIERIYREGDVWRTQKKFSRHQLRAIAELALRAQRWSYEEELQTRADYAKRQRPVS
jgi:hypothetical protein